MKQTNRRWLLIAFIGFLSLVASLLQAPAQTNLVFALSNSWGYEQTTNLDGIAWQAAAYDDTNWPSGAGLLAYETCGCVPEPIRTTLSTNNGRFTFYFRTHFNFSGNPATVSLLFSNYIDDGAVFYLNGVEIQRVGMPVGGVTYNTPASRGVGDATSADIFFVSGNLLTNLVVGDNVLAVEVHQITATSSDIVFGSALYRVTGSINAVTRGPYLQSGSHTNLVVRWRTSAASDSRVWYGTNLANLSQVANNSTNTIEHEVLLTGLSPDTTYYYAIGHSGGIVAGSNANHFFVTSPLPGTPKPTRIWVIGDSGTANPSQVSVRNAYESFTASRHTDLWLMLGDNAYNDGTDAQYQVAVFNIYTNLLRKSVLWPALGNHDTAQSMVHNTAYPYFNIFTLPRNGDCSGLGSGTEHYYSFDYGNIHFVCLDSMTASRATNGPMACWLRLDLEQTTNTWIIAYYHHPTYTKGSHNSDTEIELIQMRQNIQPILEQGGVDLVLAGHSHVYERSYLIDRHYGLSTSFNVTNKIDGGNGREGGNGAYKKPSGGPVANYGAVYAVVGSSGQNSVSTAGLNHPAMFVSLNNLGSLVLDISGNRLDAKFLRENGTTNDFFTIIKNNFAPVASNLTWNVYADAATNLVLKGGDINGDPITFLTNSLPGRGLLSNFNPTNGAFTYTPAHGFTGADSFTFRANDGATNGAPGTLALTVIPNGDATTNGLPDSWESIYGVTDPAADPDVDGLNNWQEYLAHTNPTNAASALRFTSVLRNLSGHVLLSWAAVGGSRYRIHYSDVGVAGPFTPLLRPVTVEMNAAPIGSAVTQSFIDDFSLTYGPSPSGSRFYRVEAVP